MKGEIGRLLNGVGNTKAGVGQWVSLWAFWSNGHRLKSEKLNPDTKTKLLYFKISNIVSLYYFLTFKLLPNRIFLEKFPKI